MKYLLAPLLVLVVCTACNSGYESASTEFVGDIYSVGPVEMFSVKPDTMINVSMDLADGTRFRWQTPYRVAKHLDVGEIVVKRKGDTRIAVFFEGRQKKKPVFIQEDLNVAQYWKPVPPRKWDYKAVVASRLQGRRQGGKAEVEVRASERYINDQLEYASKEWKRGDHDEAIRASVDALVSASGIYDPGDSRLVQIEQKVSGAIAAAPAQ